MRTNLTKWMLMGALMVFIGVNVIACSDDDEENSDGRTAEERARDPYDKNTEAGDALLTLLTQLAAPIDSLPNDWKTATFEPIAGTAVAGTFTRNITVSDLAEALRRYNSLTGQDLPASTRSNTWQMENVGTLTYTAMESSEAIATIDVDVKQMPHLTQLRLIPTTAIGENGSFKGEPYYRFGDVVEDKDGIRWICVRPAYSPNGKEDTHWMTFQMAKDNITTVTGSNIQKQILPTGLDCPVDKLDYLPRLLAIMANPEGYKKAAGTHGEYFDLKGLGGLDEAAMPVDTLCRQALLWQKYNVWEKIKPSPDCTSDQLRLCFLNDVNIIYKKYSKSGKKFKIYLQQYTGAGTFYRNIPTAMTPEWDGSELSFNIQNRYALSGQRMLSEYPVPDAFVVRYKSGFKLSSNWFLNPSPTEAIEGVKEVYRYNAHKGEAVANDMSKLKGDGYFHTGDIIRDNYTKDRWICVNAVNPSSLEEFGLTDKNAYFVSFDGLAPDSLYETTARMYYNSQVMGENELLPFALGVMSYAFMANQVHNNGDPRASTILAAKNYCGVDFKNMVVSRDSSMAVGNGMSKSINYFLNFAYVDNAQTYQMKGQPIMRGIYDTTLAGSQRVHTTNKDWNLKFYKYYPNTQDLMYITDVMDQEKVTKYGSKDPWVVLPYTAGTTRQQPRTQAYNFKYLSYFFWNTQKGAYAHPEVTAMYYEPVIFMRCMKLDNSKKAELDGFSVLYQTAEGQQASLDGQNLVNYMDSQGAIFLDGQMVQVLK